MRHLPLEDTREVSTLLMDSSSVILRVALGASFLSAVADRFGWWGAPGKPNVAWGSFSRFVEYTRQLNWFLPRRTIPPLAVVATCAETLLGIQLVLGWRTRAAAIESGLLLLAFGGSMTAALGVKAPLNLSVFSAMAGAFLLGSRREYPFSIDRLRQADVQRPPVRHDRTLAGTSGTHRTKASR